jgi:transposase InsO family protein
LAVLDAAHVKPSLFGFQNFARPYRRASPLSTDDLWQRSAELLKTVSDRFYNATRCHSAIGYLSLGEFERARWE